MGISHWNTLNVSALTLALNPQRRVTALRAIIYLLQDPVLRYLLPFHAALLVAGSPCVNSRTGREERQWEATENWKQLLDKDC